MFDEAQVVTGDLGGQFSVGPWCALVPPWEVPRRGRGGPVQVLSTGRPTMASEHRWPSRASATAVRVAQVMSSLLRR
jgi:hypothetical protein